MSENELKQNQINRKLPVGKNEDVEFSEALADADDREAIERMEAADNRQEKG